MKKFTADFSKIDPGDSLDVARRELLEYLKQYASHIGMTQKDIAEISGLDQPNVARVLGGKYPPKLDTLLKIVDALGLQIIFAQKI